MFISFEGIDGCGKTTQLELLAENLIKKGYQVLKLREPGGTDLSEKLRDILLNSKEEISSITELFLFEAARSHLVHSVIKPALSAGKIVITDRFYDSTTAYQGYGRGLDIKLIEQFNLTAANNIIPDLTFYLDVPYQTACQRSTSRVYDRIESSGEEFFNKVINGFREIAIQNSERVKLIDAAGEIIQTQNTILDYVLKLLKK